MNSRIKEIRKELKLTQEEFASALNVTPSAVKSWEGGKRNPPDIRINQISSMFGYRFEWIKNGTDPKKLLPISESQDILEKLERDRGKPYPKMIRAIAEIYADSDEIDRITLNKLADKLIEKMNNLNNDI